MPAGEAPAGRGVGEPGSSVRLPPRLTAKAPTDEILLSLTYRNRPSGLSPGSTAPTPPLAETWVLPSSVRAPPRGVEDREMVPDPVLTANRWRPSGLIVTQHGAVCWSATGELPIEVSTPAPESVNAETVPSPVPLCALDTNSWLGLVGRNWLPNGPTPWAVNGEPGAAVSRPLSPTVKLSICEVPTRVPTSLVPVPLKSTSPGWAAAGSATVDPGTGVRLPRGASRKAV